MLQEQLNQAYEDFRHRINSIDGATLDSFSPPLLIGVPDGWSTAEHRILWVGQETQGWDWKKEKLEADGMHWPYSDVASLADFARYESGVEALIYGYQEFAFAQNNRARNSPFWRYFRRTLEVSEQNGSSSAIWSNTVRCSTKSENAYHPWSVSELKRNEIFNNQLGLLKSEILILEPTIIFFVCGHYYDKFVKDEFQNCAYEKFPPFELHEMAKLHHKNLPSRCFRTYHPRYLNTSSLKFGPIQTALDEA